MYGKEFIFKDETYLIEKSDDYIYIALKLDHENYKPLYEGDLSSYVDENIDYGKFDYDNRLKLYVANLLLWRGKINYDEYDAILNEMEHKK